MTVRETHSVSLYLLNTLQLYHWVTHNYTHHLSVFFFSLSHTQITQGGSLKYKPHPQAASIPPIGFDQLFQMYCLMVMQNPPGNKVAPAFEFTLSILDDDFVQLEFAPVL